MAQPRYMLTEIGVGYPWSFQKAPSSPDNFADGESSKHRRYILGRDVSGYDAIDETPIPTLSQ
ncbi:MAG: hypothetical protein GY734_06995 [Herbaspirillum sp.]|uniref:hypothetical protein n=1 Tax=Herbaspirillum sp. TaxID=1890675 RepID=UPI002582DB9C|nr:hypothetical protein [Herbaspirillum sp.]MCP3656688.1 hypothetical protein [Herbaspirillum sp.]MCP3950442.1 hypothetical protein [Herbaspirillum sp.]MCP4030976.1 hypothetical protein [Herbaspirillum sp.]